MSGTKIASGAPSSFSVDTLAPGEAATFEFRMVALTTGQVTGTAFLADDHINGQFLLSAGVGDTGIPLSPDTLVLPNTVDYLRDILTRCLRPCVCSAKPTAWRRRPTGRYGGHPTHVQDLCL